MDEKTRIDAIHRLRSVAGHVNGIVRMLEEDRLAGAVSGLAIGLNGLVTAFILPLLVTWFI